MRIIKVDAIESTNVFLRNLYRDENLCNAVCIIAHHQTSGKGQMGTTWYSNPGENLTCSVFLPIEGVMIKDQFSISMLTALAICDALRELMIPKISIKWPNDILSDKSKICGILIENMVINDSLKGAIIGIGMNINQTDFPGLPNAGSLKLLSGIHFDLDEIVSLVLEKVTLRFEKLSSASFNTIKHEYESLLFRRDKPSTFVDAYGNFFIGIIKEITKNGKLLILLEDEIIKDFDLKEVQLMY